MHWLQFFLSAVAIAFIATRLAVYADAIALRTGLGRLFVGMLLLAGATSLPEMLTSINAALNDLPDLATGNLLGSNLFNMFLLAVLDMVHQNRRILRLTAERHALSGSLTILLGGLVLTALAANLEVSIGWMGADSILILLAYAGCIYLVWNHSRQGRRSRAAQEAEDIPEDTPRLRAALGGFVLSALALLILTPYLVRSSAEIATETGLGETFVGVTLLAVVTSLPELITTLMAARLGADDMAIGNLFGSNMFNIAILGFTDLFYTPGRLFAAMDLNFALVGTLGLVMAALAVVGSLARLERRLWIIEADALAILVCYGGGLALLYVKGISP